jgi:hypothetical protein
MLFIGDLLVSPAFAALTRTMKTENKRLQIRGTKYILEGVLDQACHCDLGILEQRCVVCF